MMTSRFVAAAVLAAAMAGVCSAQSAAELLQKGIYTQETAGDLDGAIQIFRQIVVSAPAQHEIAAEAQFRLAQTLVRKGDLTGAAIEYQKLARDYSEYQALISRLSTPPTGTAIRLLPQQNATEFDTNMSLSVSGVITQVLWMNPRTWIHVKDASGTDWNVALGSMSQMAQQGTTRNSLVLGQRISVAASPARDGSKTLLASTVTSDADGKLFDRAVGNVPDGFFELQAPSHIVFQPQTDAAEFDTNTSISVSGSVTSVMWINPRAWIHVKDASGVDWRVALGSPNQMMQQGATRDSLVLDQKVSVAASPAKDGSRTVLANTVTNDAGRKVFDRSLLTAEAVHLRETVDAIKRAAESTQTPTEHQLK